MSTNPTTTTRSRLLRFADLKARGIVDNWPRIKRLVESQGFPAGFHLSTNVRVWDEDAVEAWLQRRREAAQQCDGDVA